MGVNVPRKSSNLLKRRLKIAELVGLQGEIKVDDLSALLGVSGVTIRGDLNYLEQQGYLKRSFGGAIAVNLTPKISTNLDSPVAFQSTTLAQKLEIAHHCSRLISDRETLFLGHGELCRRIIPFLSDKIDLRLIVNDLQHALLAAQYIDGDIIIAGDELIRSESLLSGKAFDDTIQKYPINHCILEVSILDTDEDLVINQPLLTSHYQGCLNSAQNTIAIIHTLADPAIASASVGSINQLKHLVISPYINEHYQQLLYDADFNIRYSNNECFTWSNRNLS